LRLLIDHQMSFFAQYWFCSRVIFELMSTTATETMVQFPARRAIGSDKRGRKQFDTMAAELQAALAREEALVADKAALSQRQSMLAREFEHRLINGLQLVVSLLTLQSRTATTPEAAAQLTIASRRVSALGRVHHRLHLLDHQDKVEFKQYIQRLCEDLSGLLFEVQTGYPIQVEGPEIEIPTASAIPLGFIVNELITNSVKHAQGQITVRIVALSATSHSLSVLDNGPGVPVDFDPANSPGLGMKIILSLIKQIGGAFQILPGENGRGARFIVTFCSA
jgi:two-component sensor histidine kinase